MTVICALFDADRQDVWLGCNDGVLFGDTRMPGAKKNKWLQFGNWALGITGSAVVINALERIREHFPVDERSPLTITDFLRAAFDDVELGTREDDDPSVHYPFSGIMAHGSGRIWDVDGYMVVDEIPPDVLWANGTGMQYALGADFPTAAKNLAPEDRVRQALEASIFYDTNCPGQPIVQKLTSIRAV